MKVVLRIHWLTKAAAIGLMLLAVGRASAEIPLLPAADLSNNLIQNGLMNGLSGWQKQHISQVKDYTVLKSYPNIAVWERGKSNNDGGLLGVYQELNADVSDATKLELCLDVWVGYHSLPNTGWWSEQNHGNGEMPVHVTVAYEDANGQSHDWDHGFMLSNSGGTTLKDFTLVPQALWSHHCFNLMSDAVRRDPKRQKVLPKPAKITRVSLYGNGWDFHGAVGNVLLSSGGSAPPAQAEVGGENLIKNGKFQGMSSWQKQHGSNTKDVTSVHPDNKGFMVWKRSNSSNDGGQLGVYQDLDAEVSGAKSLDLCLEVVVNQHSLPNTGWWSEQNNGAGEMPVHITVAYEDANGQSHNWDHGFLLKNSGGTTLKNFTIVRPAVSSHHCFNLMSDAVRKDPKRQAVLPKPAKITRVSFYGNGWDFQGGVGNVVLSAEGTAPPPPEPIAAEGEDLIKNGKFRGMTDWEQQHISKAHDTISVHPDNQGFMVWRRSNSSNDGGLLGVYQDLEAEVSGARSLELCLEVKVSQQSLPNTGWWSEQNNGSGEMPVHITVTYEDQKGETYNWDYGFLAGNSGGTKLKNFAVVGKETKKHFCFDLMKPSVRKDPRRLKTLPAPAKIKRIALYGNGWDFKGAVGNVSLVKGPDRPGR